MPCVAYSQQPQALSCVGLRVYVCRRSASCGSSNTCMMSRRYVAASVVVRGHKLTDTVSAAPASATQARVPHRVQVFGAAEGRSTRRTLPYRTQRHVYTSLCTLLTCTPHSSCCCCCCPQRLFAEARAVVEAPQTEPSAEAEDSDSDSDDSAADGAVATPRWSTEQRRRAHKIARTVA